MVPRRLGLCVPVPLLLGVCVLLAAPASTLAFAPRPIHLFALKSFARPLVTSNTPPPGRPRVMPLENGGLGSRLAPRSNSNAEDSNFGANKPPARLWNLPNVLTLLRIVAIPLLIAAFYLPSAWSNALCSGLFVAASFTDYLDGYLARKMGISTPLGAFLDPVADKLMVATALVLLSERLGSPLVTVATAVIMCREIGVSALREWMASVGQRDTVAVGWWGKVKTATQMTALSVLLLVQPNPTAAQLPIIAQHGLWLKSSLALLTISAVLTVTSAAGYVKAAWPALTGKQGRGE